MHFAKKTRALSRRDRAVANDPRRRDERRHRFGDRRQTVHDRPISREQLRRVAQCDVVHRRRMPRERIVGRRVVILHVVVHRPDKRHLVHRFGQPRQMLADGDAVRLRGNRLVRAANAFRRLRLHVEHVNVTGPAELIEKNHGFGPRPGRISSSELRFPSFNQRLRPQQFRQGQPEQAQPADLQQVPPRKRCRVESCASKRMFRQRHSGFRRGCTTNQLRYKAQIHPPPSDSGRVQEW